MNVKISVFGRVQGVNFRNTVKRQANKLELVGWVQNEKDGSVTIHVQGTKENITTLHDWVKDSPGFSSVKQTRLIEVPKEKYDSFMVHRQPFLQDQAQSMLNLGRSL